MAYAERYERAAEEIPREEKIDRLFRLIGGDRRKLKSAVKYAVSAHLTEEEQTRLLREIVTAKERVLDSVLAFVERA